MRFTKFMVLFLICILAVWVALPAFATDGAANARRNAPAGQGPEGQGKVGPAVKGTSLSANQIHDLVTRGDTKQAPHKKAIAGVSAEDAKAVADYLKTLK